MKFLLLFLVSNISISLISATALQYDKKKYLSLDSLSQTHREPRSPLDNTNNVDSFKLIYIDHLLTKQDPTLTHQDLLTLRHQRGLLRTEALSFSAPASQRLFYGDGAYFMLMGVGTPSKNFYMSLNTGSDIVWLQCSPCKQCYNKSNPIFDPKESRSFSQITCGDSRCKQLQYYSDGCSDNNNTCLYNATYFGGSFSQGVFSTETLTLGEGRKTTTLKNIYLGCGYDNEGGFPDSAGLLGLGRGNLSFITQTKHQFQGQFSYCLAFPSSNTSASSIAFGPSAVLNRKDVYTPLIYTNITTMYYYVNLTGISVNGTRVPGIEPSVFDLKPNGLDGGVILDSGTTYTQLIKPAYVALRDAFREAFQKQPNSTVSVGPPLNYFGFDTCYNISFGMLGDVEVPTVELHFDQGANMTLGVDNTIIEMYDNGTVATFCFAFVSSELYTTIGNVQQQSFQIVYDLLGSRLGFVPQAC